VTMIGACAFENCKSLVSVSIPASVTFIEYYEMLDCVSFTGCTSLKEIRYGGTKSQWAAVVKSDDWNDVAPAKSVICTDGEVEL
jgi:hypothetical protein